MHILPDILPIILIAAAGYFSARQRLLSGGDAGALSRFTFSLAIPCLLFSSISTATIPLAAGLHLLLAYYSAVMAVYAVAAFTAVYLFGYDSAARSVFAMGAAYSNTTVIGIPLVVQTLGREALLPLFLLIAVQSLVLFTVGTAIAEFGQGGRRSLRAELWNLARQLLYSPITGSLIAGLVFNLAGLTLYAPLAGSVTLLGEAAIPLALFVLGTSLQQFSLGGALLPATVMSALKLVLLPLLVYLMCFHVIDLEPLWAKTALLASTLPTGISAYVFAVRYNSIHAVVAAGSLISTLLSLLPILIVLWLIRA